MPGKNVLMVIAPSNFRDEELFQTKSELEKAGATVTIASKGKGEKTGMLGGRANATVDITEADVGNYDAVVFVGGTGSAAYFNDETAKSLASKAYAEGKIVAAICIAPSILANADLLEGKKVTAFSSEAQNLQEKGATFTGKGVEVDGKIITADGPQSATEFGKTIAEAL